MRKYLRIFSLKYCVCLLLEFTSQSSSSLRLHHFLLCPLPTPRLEDPYQRYIKLLSEAEIENVVKELRMTFEADKALKKAQVKSLRPPQQWEAAREAHRRVIYTQERLHSRYHYELGFVYVA